MNINMIDIIQNTGLFQNMSEAAIESALTSLASFSKFYKKNEIILHAGNMTEYLGLILSGSVTIESNDIWGNRTILNLAKKGELFAETYALLSDEPMMVDVIANENCIILFLKIKTVVELLLSIGNTAGDWENIMVKNLLIILSKKNLSLSRRSFHTSPKSVRGRILAYLNSVSIKKCSREFDIPFDRQQMADYLNMDRTALSKELGRMQREGIICFRKNHFRLL